MNTSKFPLKDLLTLLAALVFGFSCFLSFNFLSLGETVQSIGLSLVFALILGGLAYGAKLLKKTSRNFKTCIILEWVLLFLFLCAALLAVRPFSHYFAVSEKKSIIKQKIITNITQAEGMFVAYEGYVNKRLSTYKGNLNSAVLAYKNGSSNSLIQKFDFKKGVDFNTQVTNKIFTYRKSLFPIHYAQMKLNASNWLAKAKIAVINWKSIRIGNMMKELTKNTSKWKDELIKISTFKVNGEPNPSLFAPLTIPDNDVNTNLQNYRSPNIPSILIALGLYFLMLLNYFITKRHTRFPGWKRVFKSNTNIDNSERIFITD